MKKFFNLKLVALLLVLCLALPTFVSCNDNNGEESSDSESDSQVTELLPDVPKNNYNDTFYMLVNPDCNRFGYHWVEESDNDIMSDAVYNRQEKLNKHLGVDMYATQANGLGWETAFKTAVKNKDGSFDFMLSHVHDAIETLVTGGYLMDFNQMDSINLDADYWDLDFMEGIALDDHLFLGHSDYNILYTYVVTFNKLMMDQYEDQLEESVYDMVLNYHWTLDEMISLANLVYIDKTADGKSEDDTFGISGEQWVEFVGFMHSSNLKLVDFNEKGVPVVACYNETTAAKTSDLIEKLYNLASSDCALFSYQKQMTPTVKLQTGRVLLNLTSTSALSNLLDHDVEFGILPYPMYDLAQKNVGYLSLQWGGYQCIASYLDNPQMVGDTLETLSFYSDDVKVVYYEKLLGKQASDAPVDNKMLDIVWDGICSDIAQTYNLSILYMVPMLSYVERTSNIASYMATNEARSNSSITKILKQLSKHS